MYQTHNGDRNASPLCKLQVASMSRTRPWHHNAINMNADLQVLPQCCTCARILEASGALAAVLSLFPVVVAFVLVVVHVIAYVRVHPVVLMYVACLCVVVAACVHMCVCVCTCVCVGVGTVLDGSSSRLDVCTGLLRPIINLNGKRQQPPDLLSLVPKLSICRELC